MGDGETGVNVKLAWIHEREKRECGNDKSWAVRYVSYIRQQRGKIII